MSYPAIEDEVADKRKIIVVTGASGFVGRAIVAALGSDPTIECRGCYRADAGDVPAGVKPFLVGDLDRTSSLDEVLAGADSVIHAAARTHVTRETDPEPLTAYRRINVTGTQNLLRAATAAKIRRLVFVSSIKVNGEATPLDRPFTEADPARPIDAYGVTKWEAEQALWAHCAATGLEGVVLRPPLVYGPGVKGNLLRLMRLLARGIPLPLASIRNQRSMIGLDNLVSALVVAASHPKAAGQTFPVSDETDLSTPDLLRILGCGLGRRARLLPFPPTLLKLAGGITGRSAEIERLTGSLRIDSASIRQKLEWRAPTDTSAGVAKMAHAFAQGETGVLAARVR